MATKDVWDPVVGGFVCKEVDINRRERCVSVDMNRALGQTAEPAAVPWLAKMETSIAEALKHTGPLSGRKMLDDLIHIVAQVRGLFHDLKYSRTRADEADAEVERLRAEVKEMETAADYRASELRRRDTQIIDLRVRVGDAGPPSLMKMSVELGMSRAKVEDLEAEVERLKPEAEAEADEWLIWESRNGWWKNHRKGYTSNRSDAGRYALEETKEILDRCPGMKLRVVHISEANPE